jgi:hypothetical protein
MAVQPLPESWFSLPGGISELGADASRHRVDDRMFEIDEMWMGWYVS